MLSGLGRIYQVCRRFVRGGLDNPDVLRQLDTGKKHCKKVRRRSNCELRNLDDLLNDSRCLFQILNREHSINPERSQPGCRRLNWSTSLVQLDYRGN